MNRRLDEGTPGNLMNRRQGGEEETLTSHPQEDRSRRSDPHLVEKLEEGIPMNLRPEDPQKEEIPIVPHQDQETTEILTNRRPEDIGHPQKPPGNNPDGDLHRQAPPGDTKLHLVSRHQIQQRKCRKPWMAKLPAFRMLELYATKTINSRKSRTGCTVSWTLICWDETPR